MRITVIVEEAGFGSLREVYRKVQSVVDFAEAALVVEASAVDLESKVEHLGRLAQREKEKDEMKGQKQ